MKPQVFWISAIVSVFALLPLEARAQSCFDVWMPTEVQYLAPTQPGAPAVLSFGPPTCPWAVSGGLAPPEVIVSGSAISVWAMISDTTGMGVALPQHRIDIETEPLAPGTYQLHAQFALQPGPERLVDFPLVVPAGALSTVVPANTLTGLFGLGVALVLVAAWRLHGRTDRRGG